MFHGGLYKVSNKNNPFVRNQVTTQNFMHLPYLVVYCIAIFLLSLSFFSCDPNKLAIWIIGGQSRLPPSLLTVFYPVFWHVGHKLMKVVETGRFLIHPGSHSTKILGKLICYLHASVDLFIFYIQFLWQTFRFDYWPKKDHLTC